MLELLTIYHWTRHFVLKNARKAYHAVNIYVRNIANLLTTTKHVAFNVRRSYPVYMLVHVDAIPSTVITLAQ
jgi:hypothetical protein